MDLKAILTAVLLWSMAVLATGCVPSPAAPPSPAAVGWQTSAPGEQGLDETRLRQMMDVIDAAELPIDSVVVVRHGKLAFEEYPNPEYGPQDKHLLYSVTKSVTSALIGIAIDKGFIESVDQRVIDFFPDMAIKNLDARKQNLTLEHLLTMSCGFQWEGPDDNLHTWGQANQSGNPIKFVLDQPMSSEPGTQFLYNGGCSHLLSAILTRTTGESTLEFASQHLFEPIGITGVKWPRDPQGIYYGGQDIWLTPRDMAKFGQLFLNQGTWEGRQVIPAEWVARSSETRLSHSVGGYGYQWWTFPRTGIYYASGAYEQRIFVVPDLDMVVVFTAYSKASGLKQSEMRDGRPVVDWLLGRFILPACSEYAGVHYSGFGFSMEYPSAMHASEHGLWWQGTASDVSGLVQFHYGSSPFESVGVLWDSAASYPDAEAFLDRFSLALEDVGVRIKEIQPLDSSIEDGHAVLYRQFDITEQGVEYGGYSRAWLCDERERVYIIYYATIAEVSPWLDPLTEFRRHAGSFVCHE